MNKTLGSIIATPRFWTDAFTVIIVAIFFSAVVFGWTNPNQAPPQATGALRVDSSGNVGISANSSFVPSYRLDIDAGGPTNNALRSTGIVTFTNNVGVGTAAPLSRLHIVNGSLTQDTPTDPTVLGGDAASGLPAVNPLKVFVAGRYAYMIFNALGSSGNSFFVVDVTQPASPQVVSVALSSNMPAVAPTNLFVAGRYAYVAFAGSGTNAFRIIDISNPRSPTVAGGQSLSTNMPSANPNGIVAAGRYAYVTFGASGTSAFRIIDVSNPVSPIVASGQNLNLATVAPTGIAVAGRFAYITLAGTGTNALRIVDFADINNVSVIGNGPASNMPSVNAAAIAVSGRYVYAVFSGTGTNAFRIIDVANPASPSVAGGQSMSANLPSANPNGVFVAGRYAYVTFAGTGTSAFRIIDVGTPTNPSVAGGQNLSTNMPSGTTNSLFVSGRYAHLTFSGTGSNAFRIVDVTGLEAVSASLHSLESGSLQVRENATIANQLRVGGGLSIGVGGLFTSGSLGVNNDVVLSSDNNSGAIKIFTKLETGSSVCTTTCGTNTICLAAFNSAGTNVACSDTSSNRRCLCAAFAN